MTTAVTIPRAGRLASWDAVSPPEVASQAAAVSALQEHLRAAMLEVFHDAAITCAALCIQQVEAFQQEILIANERSLHVVDTAPMRAQSPSLISFAGDKSCFLELVRTAERERKDLEEELAEAKADLLAVRRELDQGTFPQLPDLTEDLPGAVAVVCQGWKHCRELRNAYDLVVSERDALAIHAKEMERDLRQACSSEAKAQRRVTEITEAEAEAESRVLLQAALAVGEPQPRPPRRPERLVGDDTRIVGSSPRGS